MVRIREICRVGAAALAVAAITGNVSALSGFGGGQRRGAITGLTDLVGIPVEFYPPALKLRADQQAKIDAINKSWVVKGRAIYVPGTIPDPAVGEKFEALRTTTERQIMAVLTPDQQVEAPALLTHLSAFFRVTGIAMQINPELKLTRAQITRLAAIADAAEPQIDLAMEARNHVRSFALRIRARTRALAVLSSVQKTTFRKYESGGRLMLVGLPVGILADALHLTAAQQSRVEEIDRSWRTRQKTFAAPGAPTDRAAREKARALNAETETQINDVLTPDQRARVPELLTYVFKLDLLGIPTAAVPELKLSKGQSGALEALGAAVEQESMETYQENGGSVDSTCLDDGRSQARAIMTEAQKASIQRYGQ